MSTPPITVIEFDIRDRTSKDVSLDAIDFSSVEKGKIYWIHYDLSTFEKFDYLVEKLHLPEFLIQLCKEEDTVQKVIDSGDALTLQIESLIETKMHIHPNDSKNLIIHLTKAYCLTLTNETAPAIERFKENYSQNLKFALTPGFILFLLLDNVINDFSAVLQEYESVADSLDITIREGKETPYSDVIVLKNQVIKVKRDTASMRDILMRITGRKIEVVSEECRLSLIGLFHHVQMVVNEAESIRDILNSSLNLIENSEMQKMNRTMRILTSFSAIFLPLTVITGIYGMNFHWLPELSWTYGYFFALGLMVVCAAGLLLTFKKMKWF